MTKRTFGIGAAVLIPSLTWACACGCGVFDVKTSSMLPTDEGASGFFEYNFMDQNRNWNGSSRASDSDNGDKDIRTEFYTVGGQYMFSRQWGAMVEVPYANRHFETTDDGGDIVSFTHSALGDVRLRGVYSGFSPDMSSGVTFGLKLPTGDRTFSGFDRDTEIGTGSTDILLGGYFRGLLPVAGPWDWFVSGQVDQPALITEGYRPGSEIDGVAGVYYNGCMIKGIKIAPLAQVIGCRRWRDRGSAADPDNTGYDRVLLSPGVELDVGRVAVYADVAFPAYQDVNGDQLVARDLLTLRMSCSF